MVKRFIYQIKKKKVVWEAFQFFLPVYFVNRFGLRAGALIRWTLVVSLTVLSERLHLKLHMLHHHVDHFSAGVTRILCESERKSAVFESYCFNAP